MRCMTSQPFSGPALRMRSTSSSNVPCNRSAFCRFIPLLLLGADRRGSVPPFLLGVNRKGGRPGRGMWVSCGRWGERGGGRRAASGSALAPVEPAVDALAADADVLEPQALDVL